MIHEVQINDVCDIRFLVQESCSKACMVYFVYVWLGVSVLVLLKNSCRVSTSSFIQTWLKTRLNYPTTAILTSISRFSGRILFCDPGISSYEVIDKEQFSIMKLIRSKSDKPCWERLLHLRKQVLQHRLRFFFRSVQSLHLCLHSNVAYILRSRFLAKNCSLALAQLQKFVYVAYFPVCVPVSNIKWIN